MTKCVLNGGEHPHKGDSFACSSEWRSFLGIVKWSREEKRFSEVPSGRCAHEGRPEEGFLMNYLCVVRQSQGIFAVCIGLKLSFLGISML